MPQTFTVSSTSELMSALGSASGGDTILLESGNYGSVDFRDIKFNDFVTLTSADGNLGAVFSDIGIYNSSYLRIDGVHVDNSSNGGAGSKLVTVDDGSSNIDFLNSEVNGLVDSNYDGFYGLHAGGGSTSIRFEGNYVHDVRHGGVFIGADDMTVVNNTIDYIGEDSFKFGYSTGGLVEDNTGARHVYAVEGAHADFMQFHGEVSDYTIRGNTFLPETPVFSQGIFMEAGTFNNILVEQNIIVTASIRGISIESGTNITVQNNTLINIEGHGQKATKILVPSGSTVVDNVMSQDADGSVSSNGVIAQYSNPNGTAYYDDLYQNATAGFGITIEDLRPVEGSAVDFGSGMGAEERIYELLTGTDLGGTTGTNDGSVTAGDDTVSTDEDQSVTIDASQLLSNDSDSDGQALSITSVGGASNGNVVLNDDGSVTYTPNADFNGTDSFTYTVSDGSGGSDRATVSVNVGATPDAPEAGDDSASVRPDGAVTIDVLANDSDPDGDSLTIESVGSAGNGTAVDNGDGTVTYTPNSGYVGADSFTYTVNDGTGRSSTATVDVQVSDLPAALMEVNDASFDGTTSSAIVMDNDPSHQTADGTIALAFTANSTSGRQGLLSKDSTNFDAGGHVTILLDGDDVVARLQSASQTYTLTAQNVVTNGEQHTLALTFGDQGMQLYVDGAMAAENGYTGGISNNSEPTVIGANQWASGDNVANNLQDPFSGTISMAALYGEQMSASDIETVLTDASTGTGTDTTANTAPTATDDSVSVQEDGSATFAPLANDSDADGDTLSVGSLGTPSHGTAVLNGDGTVTYTPDANFSGSDSFAYSVKDGNGGTDTGVINVTVNAVNDAPTARNDAAGVRTGDSIVIPLLANDSDPEGDALQVTSLGDASMGLVTLNDDGTVTYTPNADSPDGADTFNYTISDGNGGTATASVTVNVDAPPWENSLLTVAERTFSGSTSDAVVMEHDTSYQVNEGTLALSFTADNVKGRSGLFSKDSKDFDDGGHLTAMIENGDLVVRMQSATDSYELVANDAVVAGQQYHMALTFGPEGMTLYVDGQVADTNAYTGGIGSNQEPIVLGANQWASGDLTADKLRDPFDGTIQQTSLYGQSMTADEVKSLATYGDGGTPVAADDSFRVTTDTSTTFDVMANDFDPDGDALALSDLGAPTNGSLSVNADGTLTYVPDAGYEGSDSFQYAVTDGAGNHDVATVRLDVGQPGGTFDGTTGTAEVQGHQAGYELSDGTLTMSFTADDTNGVQGLMSKDSYGYDAGGHMTILLDGDDLIARLQSDSATHTLTARDAIVAGQEHDLAASFGSDGFKLYLDGQLVDTSGFTGGISSNTEPVVLGANQWASGDNVADVLEDPFDGTIQSAELHTQALSGDQVQTVADGGMLSTDALDLFA